jgi:RluA family pseudouridine synthase
MEGLDLRPEILFEDAAILVVNKPAGLLSLQDGYDKKLPHLSSVLSPEYGRLWMVHRLDRETSGVIILARSAEAHHHLNDQFMDRLVKKVYHALAAHVPSWSEKLVDAPLRKNGDRRHRTVVDWVRGKPAQTEFQIIEIFSDFVLIEARPRSGYTHQIRAHISWLGLPLAGDSLYGSGIPIFGPATPETSLPPAPILNRPALHALSITFQHPISGQSISFMAPYPGDFCKALAFLRAL